MAIDWQLQESGPTDAERTVLLLPGGMCSAGSFAELMAEPALARVRLVAATLPGHSGAALLDVCSIENDEAHKLVARLVDLIGAAGRDSLEAGS